MEEEKGFSLADIFMYVRNYIILICAVVFVTLILGSIYVFALVKPTYQATTSVLVQVDKVDSSSGSSNTYDITTSQKMVDSAAKYMEERLVLKEVVKDEDIIALAKKNDIQLTVGYVSNHLSVASSTTDLFVTVRVTTINPELSKLIANSVVQNANKIADDDIRLFKDVFVLMDPAENGTDSSPNKLIYVVASFAVGLALAFVIIVLKELLDNTFRTQEEVESLTGLQSLGFVANFNNQEDADTRYELVKKNAYYYEKLVVNLDYANIDSNKKVYQVASAVEKEGKTITLLYLAWINTMRNKKVVVVDLDLRKPRLHRGLKIPNQNGVTDFIVGKVDFDDLIVKTEYGFDAILAGGKTPFILDVLGSQKMTELIERLKKEYDYVLIDTPPVSVAADAISISKHSDGIVYLVSYKNVKRNVCLESLKELKSANAPVIGSFYTNVDIKKIKNYEYYYYYYKTKEDPVDILAKK